MSRYEDQRALQRSRQGIGLLLRLPVKFDDRDQIGYQRTYKENQIHHASLHQGLNIVVMGIFSLIVERLDTDDTILKDTHTRTNG